MYEPLLDLSAVWDGCGDIHPPASAVAGHIVITMNGNCTITQKAQTIEVGVHTAAIDICNKDALLIFKICSCIINDISIFHCFLFVWICLIH